MKSNRTTALAAKESVPTKGESGTDRSGLIFWGSMTAGVAFMAALIWLVDLKALHQRVEAWNGITVFLAMALLPLVGAPVSVLYVAGGAKFGHFGGLVLAAAAITVHLIGSWWIAHSWLRQPLDALFRRTRYRKPQIPEGEYVSVCLLIALVPGLPYTLKNYLMALGGVPFRPYFWACLPAHFFHAVLGVLFGDFTGAMTTPKIIFLVVYAVVLVGLSHHVVRRLRARRMAATAP